MAYLLSWNPTFVVWLSKENSEIADTRLHRGLYKVSSGNIQSE